VASWEKGGTNGWTSAGGGAFCKAAALGTCGRKKGTRKGGKAFDTKMEEV